MPQWSQILSQDDPLVGEKVTAMEQFAQKLEAKKPNPGNVSFETSMMLVMLSSGDDDVLDKLRTSLLRSDVGGMVKTLEEFKHHDEVDLRYLRESFDKQDKIGISNALRRMAGDRSAGTTEDEFKDFVGKGYVRQGENGYERMPFIEEAHSARSIYEIGNCWKAARNHNSTLIVTPTLMPRQQKQTETYVCVNMGAEHDWEQLHGFNIIEANIANANGDLLTGIVNPESGSLVMSQFDPTIPQEMEGFGTR